MGMYVSQLRSVPVGKFTYYFYFVDVSGNGKHTAAIATALQELAIKSGTSALVVSGTPNLTREVFEFLANHAASDFARLESLFHNVSSLVVSEGALQTTKTSVFVVPLIAQGESREGDDPFVVELVKGFLEAMKTGAIADYCKSLGAESLDLSGLKGGLLVTTLRNANEFLDLKPGIAGVSVNLNAVLERFVGPSTRQLPSNSKE